MPLLASALFHKLCLRRLTGLEEDSVETLFSQTKLSSQEWAIRIESKAA